MNKHFSMPSLVRYFTLIVAVFFSSLPLSVSATSLTTDFMQDNNILYYDPGNGGVCSTVGPSYSTGLDLPSLSGNSNAEKIWGFLKSEGLSDEQAAGIMGNLKQESNYEPDALEGNSVGYGIIQWSYERRNGYDARNQHKSPPPIGGLEKAAQDKGIPASNLAFQLVYMKQEAESTNLINFNNLYSSFGVSSSDNAWDPLKDLETIERATTFWHDAFERSNDYNRHGDIQHRIDFAKEAFQQFTGRAASGSPEPSGGANCSSVGSGDLSAMTLEYAWPEWKGSGFVEMMPAYKAVVDKGTSYRDMGGQAYRGVDCVGFVTTLIIDSGFDPNFNFAGKYYGKGEGRGTDIVRKWLEDSKNGWEKIASEGKKTNGEILSSSDLQPGDVAVTPLRHQVTDGGSIPGHTFVFVGQIDGFDSQYASASMDDRAPMATSGDYESAANTKFEWFRKVR